MGVEKPPKSQFNFRVPPAVLAHLEHRYRQTGVEKQLQALAGLVAYECASERMRVAAIQWATRIAAGEASWKEFEEVARKRKGEYMDHRILTAALRSLADSVEATESKRRPA